MRRPSPIRQLRRLSPARLSPLVVALAFAAAACAPAGEPASFDPAAPCGEDVRLAGAYPALESLIPAELDGAALARVDSGRNCQAASLATLATRGIDEIRFAGGLWERGERSGTTLAIFEADGLDYTHLAEWYDTAARRTSDAETPELSERIVGNKPGVRIDTLVAETSFQTVVLWSDPGREDTVRVVLVATDVQEQTRDEHEAAVDLAIETFSGD